MAEPAKKVVNKAAEKIENKKVPKPTEPVVSKPAESVVPKPAEPVVSKPAELVKEPKPVEPVVSKPADKTKKKKANQRVYLLDAELKQKSSCAVGRRKRAVAVVTIQPGPGYMRINRVPSHVYWQYRWDLIQRANECLGLVDKKETVNVEIQVKGGGLVAQSHAVRLALSRAMCLTSLRPKSNTQADYYRRKFRRAGLLTQDGRIKERKKYGLKKARKAAQYSKR